MGAHLSDRTKKKIIADRLDGMSYRRLAEKYKVSRYAIELAIKSDPDFSQKMIEKKEQNSKDMIEFLDEQKLSAQEFILLAMEKLKDPDKLEKTGIQSIATAMGIIIDKFMPTQKQDKSEGVEIVWGKQE